MGSSRATSPRSDISAMSSPVNTLVIDPASQQREPGAGSSATVPRGVISTRSTASTPTTIAEIFAEGVAEVTIYWVHGPPSAGHHSTEQHAHPVGQAPAQRRHRQILQGGAHRLPPGGPGVDCSDGEQSEHGACRRQNQPKRALPTKTKGTPGAASRRRRAVRRGTWPRGLAPLRSTTPESKRGHDAEEGLIVAAEVLDDAVLQFAFQADDGEAVGQFVQFGRAVLPDVAALHGDLALEQLVLGLGSQVFAGSHADGARHGPGDAGQQDIAGQSPPPTTPAFRSSIRHQAVVGAEDGVCR